MIYRLDDLCESQDFEHDQKFVKAEHWKEACDELEDKVKTVTFKDQEITKLKKSLEVANEAIEFYANEAKFIDGYEHDESPVTRGKIKIWVLGKRAREAQKQIKEIMGGHRWVEVNW